MRAAVPVGETAQAPNDLIATLDDVIDQALQALQQGDSAAALERLQEADATVDNLMTALGVPDSDEDEASLPGLAADAKDSVMAEVRHVAKQDGVEVQEGTTMPELDLSELEELDRQLADLTR